MSERFDISVVLGSKNRKNLIKSTINSIRNNGFNGKIEIIVVDGGSSDGTCNWLGKQKDVFTIIQPNYSIIDNDGVKCRKHTWGEFMNIGFKYAHSDYIVMVSDDLILAQGCLQKAYDELKNRIDAGEKVGGGAFFFREYPRHDYFRVIKIPKGYININHGIYYRPAMVDVGWLDEVSYNFYCGDGDFTMRLNETGWKTIPLYDCFALHLVHLPKNKNKIPEWYYRDKNAFKIKYPFKRYGDMIINDEKPKIKASAFWKYALKNVLIGYLLRFRDKRHK